MTNLKSQKKHLREQMHALLQAKGSMIDPVSALKSRDLFLKHFAGLDSATIVAITLSIQFELETTPLLDALYAKKVQLCLPVVMGKGDPLTFRSYKPGDTLIESMWGLREPVESVPEVEPDLIVCPLLAFDRKGGRLGRGAGYYDATLRDVRKRRRVQAVGYAYAHQEVKEVPTGSMDERLDLIITEKEIISPPFGRG